MSTSAQIPDAEILINTGCAHCPAVLSGLSELVKEGLIGRLQVINAGRHPEEARARNARSVPWTRIGPFTLEGSYTPAELRAWAERASGGEGMGEYFGELLQNQQIERALDLVRQSPARLQTLLALLADLETPMGVRIGIGAMFEDLAEHGDLEPALPGLVELTRAPEPQLRADAAYYIGLLGADTAREHLQALLQDDNHEVREIAAEALQA
jgi:hypothetical protein